MPVVAPAGIEPASPDDCPWSPVGAIYALPAFQQEPRREPLLMGCGLYYKENREKRLEGRRWRAGWESNPQLPGVLGACSPETLPAHMEPVSRLQCD